MRLIALILVLVTGTLHVHARPVPVPLNCAVDLHSAQKTRLGTVLGWTRPGHRTRGHAHNDYEHDRPLVDALDAGLRSVEVDVWAVDGELLVAHARDEVDPARTLAGLYLEPLARHFAGPRRSASAPRLQLLIDIKSRPSEALPLLRAQLADHARMLTRYRGCSPRPGPVSVVVSGEDVRPAAPASERVSYFGYDMQPERTQHTGPPEAITPLVSAQWDSYFTWDGGGSMPETERARLMTMVRTAHAAGSAIRFYDTPDDRGAARDAVWRELVAAAVDYISTDDLTGFAAFRRGVHGSRGAVTHTLGRDVRPAAERPTPWVAADPGSVLLRERRGRPRASCRRTARAPG
jgi:hypothetical protein